MTQNNSRRREEWISGFVQRMNSRTGPHWEDYERKAAEFRALGEELFDHFVRETP